MSLLKKSLFASALCSNNAAAVLECLDGCLAGLGNANALQREQAKLGNKLQDYERDGRQARLSTDWGLNGPKTITIADSLYAIVQGKTFQAMGPLALDVALDEGPLALRMRREALGLRMLHGHVQVAEGEDSNNFNNGVTEVDIRRKWPLASDAQVQRLLEHALDMAVALGIAATHEDEFRQALHAPEDQFLQARGAANLGRR